MNSTVNKTKNLVPSSKVEGAVGTADVPGMDLSESIFTWIIHSYIVKKMSFEQHHCLSHRSPNDGSIDFNATASHPCACCDHEMLLRQINSARCLFIIPTHSCIKCALKLLNVLQWERFFYILKVYVNVYRILQQIVYVRNSAKIPTQDENAGVLAADAGFLRPAVTL